MSQSQSVLDFYPNEAFAAFQGVGMTSQRTRDRLIDRLVAKGVRKDSVLESMRILPRHLFIDEAIASRAYEDTALPIGYGQTLSQPWVVAVMTQFILQTSIPLNKVLEIGTGSGYQTAILALLTAKVYSVERIAGLLERAQNTLQRLQLNNIELAISDGYWGWPEQAPFDAILSAASPKELPEELMQQLKTGGRLVMPIGEQQQQLMGYEKTSTGFRETCLGEVMFVPMQRGTQK